MKQPTPTQNIQSLSLFCWDVFSLNRHLYLVVIQMLVVPARRRYIRTQAVRAKTSEWHHFSDTCCSWTSSADELFLERNGFATICSWTVHKVTALICISLLHLWLLVCASNKLLKVKDIWYVIFQHSDVLHTPSVFSYVFQLQSPQAVEWWLERHYFSDACCS